MSVLVLALFQHEAMAVSPGKPLDIEKLKAHPRELPDLIKKAETGPDLVTIKKAVDDMISQAEKPKPAPTPEEEAKEADDAVKLGQTYGISTNLISHQRMARGAWCGIHAASAGESLAKMGGDLAATLQNCVPIHTLGPKPTLTGVKKLMEGLKNPCAATMENLFGSLILGTGFITMAASECATSASIDTACGGVIQLLIGSLLQTQSAGQVALTVCDNKGLPPSREWVMPARRLQTSEADRLKRVAVWDAKADMTKAQLDTEMAICVVQVSQIATALAAFGTAVDQSIQACTLKAIAKPIPKIGTQVMEWCMVEISYVLYAIFGAAQFLSSAVSHCGKAIGVRAGSECAASILRITTNVAGLPLLAGGLDTMCPGTTNSINDLAGPFANTAAHLTGLGRRLSGESDEDHLHRGLELMANFTDLITKPKVWEEFHV